MHTLISLVDTVAKDSLTISTNSVPIKKGTELKLPRLDKAQKHYIHNKKYYYQEHWEIVPNADPVKRQLERLSKYSDDSINFGEPTKYFSQRDNYIEPLRTCNSSSNACYLQWLQTVSKRTPIQSDNEYLKHVKTIGDTTEHWVHTEVLQSFYGFKTAWMTDKDLEFVKSLLANEFPVVVNILHRGSLSAPKGGHIITLVGINDNKQFVAQDPYGTLASGYTNHNGRLSSIGFKEFSIRWQGGYRILTN